MTFSYRDPTLLASTLTPLVDLADKVVRLQRELDLAPALHSALRAAEERIAQCIGEYLEVKVQSPDPAEDDAIRVFRVGDRVRIARKVDVDGWVDEMDATIGREGQISKIDESVTDAIPIYVRLPGGARFYYPPSALEKVSDHTTDEDSK